MHLFLWGIWYWLATQDLMVHGMAWVGRELKDHQVLTLCHRQCCQQLDQILDHIAQGPIQSGLDHLQWWGIHSLSGQWYCCGYPTIAPKTSQGSWRFQVCCWPAAFHVRCKFLCSSASFKKSSRFWDSFSEDENVWQRLMVCVSDSLLFLKRRLEEENTAGLAGAARCCTVCWQVSHPRRVSSTVGLIPKLTSHVQTGALHCISPTLPGTALPCPLSISCHHHHWVSSVVLIVTEPSMCLEISITGSLLL